MSSNAKKKPTLPPLRWEGGRIVPLSLADPAVEPYIDAMLERRRRSRKALLAHYVEQGVLTPEGKLTPKYGG